MDPSPTRSELRIALLVDAIHPRARSSGQPSALAAAMRDVGATAEVVPIHAGVLARVPREGPQWREEERRAQLSRAEGDAELEADPVLGGLLSMCPDALLAYDASSPAAWIGGRAAGRLQRPLVLIEPGWTSMRSLRDRVLEGVGRRLWGRLVRSRAEHVFVVDPLARELALDKGFRSDRCELLPVGVDTEHFRPGRPSDLVRRHRLRGRILLCVGPLEQGRGVELLVRAFARSVGQREDWCLVLAGGGSHHRRIVALASRLGIAARVHMIEYPSLDELPGLFGASTLLAVPALDDRTRGAQIPRALACGLPVLCADVERLAFQLEDGVHGLVVAAGDEDAWRLALTRAAGSPELRRKWSVAARELAATRAWPLVADRVLTVLEERLAVRAGAVLRSDAQAG